MADGFQEVPHDAAMGEIMKKKRTKKTRKKACTQRRTLIQRMNTAVIWTPTLITKAPGDLFARSQSHLVNGMTNK